MSGDLPLATVELPFGGGDGACAAPFDGRLHLFVIEGARSTHASIDASGRASEYAHDIAFAVVDAAAISDGLVLVGDTDDGDLVVAALDADGRERWRHALDAVTPLLHAPIVCARGDRATVAWEEDRGDASILAWCDVDADGTTPVQRMPLADTTLRLAATAIDAGLVVARLAGMPPRATLLRIVGGEVVARREVVDVGSGPIALARDGDDIALALSDAARLVVARFDATLTPLGPSRISAAQKIDRLGAFDGWHAVFVGTRWPAKPAVHGIVPADGASARVFIAQRAFELPQPVGRVEAGGWIGDRFVLVHGDDVLAASVFAS
jgi:hypothetical protein